MREVLCLVLGGGRGTRLYPLTKVRSKPATPFAAKYRLIDIPISNSLNSGFRRIYVLTQFNAGSLNQHIARTYNFDNFSGRFVEIMSAEQSMDNVNWFQGTADAVRRCLKHLNSPNTKYVLILSGDQLYKMDFSQMLHFHREKKSQITIACHPVIPEDSEDYGIMCTDKKGRINSFIEKPSDKDLAKRMSMKLDGAMVCFASMGIYLFDKQVIVDILSNNEKADFGKEIIPDSFSSNLTHAYIHRGYWKDIGTIDAFYRENLVFTDSIPPIDLFDIKWPFFTRPRQLPPAKIEESKIDRTLIGEGSILNKCNIYHSVVGLRSRIMEEASIEDSIVMGADFYQLMSDMEKDKSIGLPPVGLGKRVLVKKAIIDKNVRIGDEVKIINKDGLRHFDADNYSIRDGIVIVHKNSVIPSGTVI